jgi:hypothetical protein
MIDYIRLSSRHSSDQIANWHTLYSHMAHSSGIGGISPHSSKHPVKYCAHIGSASDKDTELGSHADSVDMFPRSNIQVSS